MSVLGILFALGEKVYFTVFHSLKKFDPGAQCGIEYYMMYCKFARKNVNFWDLGFLLSKAKMHIHVIN